MWCEILKVFVNNTNLTFLSFLYKININYLQLELNSQHWPSLVYKSDAYPTVLSRHVLTVSDFQILIKSCCIESRIDPIPKSEVMHEAKFILKISCSTHVCLAQLDKHQTCKPVMVSCEFNSNWRQLLQYKLCTKMSEMSDLCYLRKPRLF